MAAFLLLSVNAFAQHKKKKQSKVKSKAHTSTAVKADTAKAKGQSSEELNRRAQMLVASYTYMLNLLGDSSTPQQEKNDIIASGYQKLFLNADVKVEDDLDPFRETIVHKAIPAYLQDVDFFYKNVKFEMVVQNLTELTNTEQGRVYKATLNRAMLGLTFDDDTVDDIQQRYIEFNYKEQQQDLRIASVYTTNPNRGEDILNWWKELPDDWKYFVREKIGVNEGDPDEATLKEFTSRKVLSLQGFKGVVPLEPLFIFNNLQELRLSSTAITDLTTIRLLKKLERIYLDSTRVTDLRPLQYCTNLKEISISETGISDISPLARLLKLESVDASYSLVKRIPKLSDNWPLKSLNLSHSFVANLEGINKLSGLEKLNISNTRIADLTPLKGNTSLKQLNIERCLVKKLSPLSGITSLELIYADGLLLDPAEISEFQQARPKAVLVSKSSELNIWWNGLSEDWKKALLPGFIDEPDKEQLAKLTKLLQLDLSGKMAISDLRPLKPISSLQRIKLNGTAVENLATLSTMHQLQWLDISNTRVHHLSSLNGLKKLNYLRCNATQIDSCQIIEFIKAHPHCSVLFMSEPLQDWWKALPTTWKQSLSASMNWKDNPGDEALHKLFFLDTLSINGNVGSNLNPLMMLRNLKKLALSDINPDNLLPLKQLQQLVSLHITNAPIRSLEDISDLYQLKELTISNAGIKDLKLISGLRELEVLDFSGNHIESIKPLSTLFKLRELNCSNTSVKDLEALDEVPGIVLLKCFNTRLKQGDIKDFQKEHPNCRVLYY